MQRCNKPALLNLQFLDMQLLIRSLHMGLGFKRSSNYAYTVRMVRMFSIIVERTFVSDHTTQRYSAEGLRTSKFAKDDM